VYVVDQSVTTVPGQGRLRSALWFDQPTRNASLQSMTNSESMAIHKLDVEKIILDRGRLWARVGGGYFGVSTNCAILSVNSLQDFIQSIYINIYQYISVAVNDTDLVITRPVITKLVNQVASV